MVLRRAALSGPEGRQLVLDGGYLASRLLKHWSLTFDRVTDSLIFNMDCVSNGSGRSWFPVPSYRWKCLAWCAHQRLLFQHIHKFLSSKDVRPRKRSLFHCPPPRVTRVYRYHQQCPGQIWFLQISAWFLKHFRSWEPPVLNISTPWMNCQVSKKNRWLFD